MVEEEWGCQLWPLRLEPRAVDTWFFRLIINNYCSPDSWLLLWFFVVQTMSQTKPRRREPKYNQVERETLVRLVESSFTIVENKKTDGATNQQKLECWNRITLEFNACLGSSRSQDSLKCHWDNLKREAEEVIAREHENFRGTGKYYELVRRIEISFSLYVFMTKLVIMIRWLRYKPHALLPEHRLIFHYSTLRSSARVLNEFSVHKLDFWNHYLRRILPFWVLVELNWRCCYIAGGGPGNSIVNDPVIDEVVCLVRPRGGVPRSSPLWQWHGA